MKEILLDLFKSTSARIKHPLIGSFMLTHVFYNWNYYLVLIFSNLSIEHKILYIKTHTNYWNFFTPLAISILYIICFPYINIFFNLILEKAKVEENNSQVNSLKRIMKVKLLEANHERQIAEEKAGTKELETLKNQIEILKEQSDNLYKEKEELISINNKSNSDYNKILKELENQKDFINKSLNIDYSILENINNNLTNSAKQLLLKFEKYNKGKRSVIIEPDSGDYVPSQELIDKKLIINDLNKKDKFSFGLSDLGKICIQLLKK
ncbi:TPA: hypothetical protein ACGZ9U_001999 [Elizabethkingia anophelis]